MRTYEGMSIKEKYRARPFLAESMLILTDIAAHDGT